MKFTTKIGIEQFPGHYLKVLLISIKKSCFKNTLAFCHYFHVNVVPGSLKVFNKAVKYHWCKNKRTLQALFF